MGISVLIASTTRNANTKAKSLSITKALGEAATCELTTEDITGSLIPDVGNNMEVQDSASDTQFFGSLQEVTTTKLGRNSGTACKISVTDLNHATTRRNAGQYEWIGKTVLEIVTDMVANSLFSDLTDISLVETGPTIPNFKVDMCTVKVGFDALAELAGMRWYVDELNRLNFFVPSGTADAPFAISGGSNVARMSVRKTREDYCNSVSARVGNSLRDPEVESFVGDGAKTSFAVTYRVGSAPSITLDTVPVTVGIGDVDTGKEWYWNQGSKEIRQDVGGVVLTAGNTLDVTYSGVESIIVATDNPAEIAARATAEGNSGVYHVHLELEEFLSRSDALATIEAYLDRHDDMTFVLSVETNERLEANILALRPGQVLNFTAAGYGTTGLFLVKSVTLIHNLGFDQADYQWSCVFEAVKGPLLSNFVDLFRSPGGGGSASGTASLAGGSGGSGTYVYEPAKLTAAIMVTSPIAVTTGARLTVYITQGASPWVITFDPTTFAQVTNNNISAVENDVSVFDFTGRSDGLWWPSSFSMTGLQ